MKKRIEVDATIEEYVTLFDESEVVYDAAYAAWAAEKQNPDLRSAFNAATDRNLWRAWQLANAISGRVGARAREHAAERQAREASS